jgi:protein phosphatase
MLPFLAVAPLASGLVARSYALTDVGRRRKLNEDAYHHDDELGLYVVADGVGGQAKGEIASGEAVDQLLAFVRQGRDVIAKLELETNNATVAGVRRLVESAVQSACYVVFGMAEQDPSQKGMSTTISALLLAGDRAFIAQVGDSRVYRIRDGISSQLTEDHTLINYKIKQGQITREQASQMKGKNVITRAVGHRDYVEVDTIVTDLCHGDRFVLCSDGLHGYLEEGELESVVLGSPPRHAPERLVQIANDRGGKDNITVIVAYVD